MGFFFGLLTLAFEKLTLPNAQKDDSMGKDKKDSGSYEEKLVTIAIHTYDKAHILKSILESEGIPAVIHGINQLWDLGMSVQELCQIGQELGADVPFCLMGQAAGAPSLKEGFAIDPMASGCALATGIGTELLPLKGAKAHIVLSKPPISVSTREVYQGLRSEEIQHRPDTRQLLQGLEEENWALIEKNMVNVLEFYTLKMYDKVVYTKNKMREACPGATVLMSGSGPTVFGFYKAKKDARRVYEIMKSINKETFLTETTP